MRGGAHEDARMHRTCYRSVLGGFCRKRAAVSEKAADLALRQCVDQALATSQIKGQNGQELEARG